MRLSSYHSAFNLIKNNFNYTAAIDNYCNFFDEVVIAVNTSEDDTLESLNNLKHKYSNLFIYSCDFPYDDYAFDGKIKNFALQKCTGDFFTLLDLDEFIPLNQKSLWRECAKILELNDLIDCLLIASINLCKDIYHYKDISRKFYLHKKGLHRGIWNGAKKKNGKIDISKSDTCEILMPDGNLARCYPVTNKIEDLQTGRYPFVFHDWGTNLNQRIKQNQIWRGVWENRAGEVLKDEILTQETFEKIEVFEHNLFVQ